MKSKHTPGPWEATLIEEGLWHIERTDDVQNHKWVPIAIVDHHRDMHDATRRETAPANARLIASSPDLYAALYDCAEMLELALGRIGCSIQANNGGGSSNHDSESFGGVNTLARVRSVLRKAEGNDAPDSQR